MTEDDKHGLIILGLFAFVWWWQKGKADVTLKSTCVFPDGTEILVPLGDPCPYDEARGGQSVFVESTV